MKSLLSLVLFLTALPAATSSASVIGGRVDHLRAKAFCSFDDDGSRTLEMSAYGKQGTSGISYALVTIRGKNGRGASAETRIRLRYLDPAGLSLVMRFRNDAKRAELEIVGDDRGGMSSLELDGERHSLTCALEE